MKYKMTGIFLVAAMASASVSSANLTAFDKHMSNILAEYLKIQDKLALDSSEGVATASKKIEAMAAGLKLGEASANFRRQYKNVPGQVLDASKQLSKEADIKKQREAFKLLSRPVVNWVELSKPDGMGVYFCDMAPGGWVQKKGDLRNPYYGASMLRCFDADVKSC